MNPPGTPGTGPLSVRARVGEDLPELLRLLAISHAEDGYPVRAAAVRADWLAPSDELEAAVATDGGRVVGHVGLHPVGPHDDPVAVSGWQGATGRTSDELAVVSRLFTDRSVRGAGTVLLGHAVSRASTRGLAAVLLVDPESSARGFYGRRGWREVGISRQQWGHRTVDAVLMVAP